MSSGEKAKPPAFEERNPFDISRRSGTEVAAEIAKRMVAWKQARGRSYATPSTVPGSAAEPHEAKSHEAKQPPIAAPVQPVRAPKPQQEAGPRQPDDSAHGSNPRVPYFATFSIQRAMPSAPSPKRIAAEPQPALPGAPAASAEPSATTLAPQPEFPAADILRESIIASAAEAVEAQPTEAATQGPNVAEADAGSGTLESSTVEERRIDPPAAEAAPAPDDDEIERRRAKARDIRARWIAAHDVDFPLTVAPALAAEPAVPEDDAHEGGASSTEAPSAAAAIPSIEVLEDLSGRKEPTFVDAVAATAMMEDEPAAGAPAPVPAAPTFEKAQQPKMAAAHEERPAEEITDIAPDLPPIEELEIMSGRKEPTFADDAAESPAAMAKAEQPVPATAAQETRPPEEIADIAPDLPPIEELEIMSGRKEPTFDAPIRTKKPTPAAASAGSTKARIELPAMQTRIEARRIDTLRAEPHLAIRRPVFPHIDPEQWEIASPIPTSAQRTRRGTGWAIGLGAVLLLIGVTAPAALWQQGRQSQDDVAMVPVTVAPQQPASPPAPQPAAPQQAAHQPESQSSQQAASTAPEPEPALPQAPATPGATDQSAQTARLPSAAPKPEAKDAAADQPAPEQTTLGPIRNSSELAEAPISAPPPPAQEPVADLASKTRTKPSSSAMVAKPFVPEAGPKPFLRAPTVGGTSVSVDGGSRASTGAKPALIGQLKPKAPAAAKPVSPTPQTFARKPRPFLQQTPEQMFQTLVETLGQGKPPNPALTPPPPSTRK